MAEGATYLLERDTDRDRRSSRMLSALRPKRLHSFDEIVDAARRGTTSDLWILLHAGQAPDAIRAATIVRKQLGLLLLFDRVDDVQDFMPLQAAFRKVMCGPRSCFLPLEELGDVLMAENKSDLAIGGAIDQHSKTLTLYRGDGSLLIVPLSVFRASGTETPDHRQIAVADYGQTLQFGKYEASVESVLYEFDPEFRRRQTERRLKEDRGFGASLRRLRRLKGLKQSDFQPLAAKTIARIEKDRTSRPHGKTLQTIERRLGVPASEIETY